MTSIIEPSNVTESSDSYGPNRPSGSADLRIVRPSCIKEVYKYPDPKSGKGKSGSLKPVSSWVVSTDEGKEFVFADVEDAISFWQGSCGGKMRKDFRGVLVPEGDVRALNWALKNFHPEEFERLKSVVKEETGKDGNYLKYLFVYPDCYSTRPRFISPHCPNQSFETKNLLDVELKKRNPQKLHPEDSCPHGKECHGAKSGSCPYNHGFEFCRNEIDTGNRCTNSRCRYDHGAGHARFCVQARLSRAQKEAEKVKSTEGVDEEEEQMARYEALVSFIDSDDDESVGDSISSLKGSEKSDAKSDPKPKKVTKSDSESEGSIISKPVVKAGKKVAKTDSEEKGGGKKVAKTDSEAKVGGKKDAKTDSEAKGGGKKVAKTDSEAKGGGKKVAKTDDSSTDASSGSSDNFKEVPKKLSVVERLQKQLESIDQKRESKRGKKSSVPIITEKSHPPLPGAKVYEVKTIDWATKCKENAKFSQKAQEKKNLVEELSVANKMIKGMEEQIADLTSKLEHKKKQKEVESRYNAIDRETCRVKEELDKAISMINEKTEVIKKLSDNLSSESDGNSEEVANADEEFAGGSKDVLDANPDDVPQIGIVTPEKSVPVTPNAPTKKEKKEEKQKKKREKQLAKKDNSLEANFYL